jgi:hypothetical protein
MTMSVRARAISGVAGAVLALLVAGAPAQAAPAANDSSVSVGRLVLDPSDRGYHGTLSVTIRYRGAQAEYRQVSIVEPVPGSFDNVVPMQPCFFGDTTPRRTLLCEIPGGELQPGENRTFGVAFTVLTTARDYPMVSTGGMVTVDTDDAKPANNSASFDAVFRSTSGSVRDPQPYVRDTLTDASVSAGTATLVRQPDGSYLGGVPVTIRYGGDAPHSDVALVSNLPAGVELRGIEPVAPCMGGWCHLDGYFMPGEERTVTLKLVAAPGTVAGPLGTGTTELHVRYDNNDLADVDATDNSASFVITAVEAG